ncbi:MAG TPA: hypothetical protein VN428_26090 [Bryobacteraceae bacterium]|nr:hypothetical protein [Bryobacteraceae bacterium]
MRFVEEQVGAIAPLGVFGAEIAAMLAVALYAVLAGRTAAGEARRAESFWVRLARRKGLAVLAVTLTVFTARLALLPVMPLPEPVVMDEFSYLLAADTFASGRIANPPHPFWKHFETFYVLQQPAYASIYPPGSGLFMAAGQALTGHPWTGVLGATAVMCGAVTWMLQGWMPPQWALLGGALAAVRIGIFSYWMNSYWGGSVPAIAGALVLGAAPRLVRTLRAGYAIVLGLGLVLLANTRPYEGLFVAAPVLVFLAARAFAMRRTPLFRARGFGAAVSLGLCLIAGAAATGYYVWRITGSPVVLPYAAYDHQYRPTSNFLTTPAKPIPHYNHKIFQDHYVLDQLPFHHYLRKPANFVRRNIARARNVWLFYYGPVLTIPLLMLPFVLRDRRVRLLGIAVGFVFAGSLIVFAPFPHYFAPVTGALVGIAIQGLRHMRAGVRLNRGFGFAAVRAIPVALATVAVFGGTAQALGIPLRSEQNLRPDRRMSWTGTPPGGIDRARIVRELIRAGGQHLVFVRYAPGHDPMFDWVYNSATPDRAPVVFAREVTPEADRALMAYFSGRRVWIAEPDAEPVRLAAIAGPPTGQHSDIAPARHASAGIGNLMEDK